MGQDFPPTRARPKVGKKNGDFLVSQKNNRLLESALVKKFFLIMSNHDFRRRIFDECALAGFLDDPKK